MSTMSGADITTLEGLGTPEKPHPIQKAFIDEQAAQCGFCLSGVVTAAKAYLDQNPKATDAQIQQAMSTVLCRCFTTTRMMKAISALRDGACVMKNNTSRQDEVSAEARGGRRRERSSREAG